MYLLDSSAIIEILHNTGKGRKIMDFIGKNSVCTTSISVYEILIGLKEKESEKMHSFFSSIKALPFDENSAKFSADIEKKLIRSGKTINKVDILIAGICRSNNKIIITLDSDFKRIQDIKSIII